jgi:hypothetical protein
MIIPAGWCDWLSSFLKRKNSLSIRTPRATSLDRETSFNEHNVEMLFANLNIVRICDKYKFQLLDVYNVDETAITTVQNPNVILARKGVKQVEAMTFSERGSLVTMAVAVSASGNSIPPFFVFPKKKKKKFGII